MQELCLIDMIGMIDGLHTETPLNTMSCWSDEVMKHTQYAAK